MPKVFVVTAETGEYSCRSNWVVAVYPTEAQARKHVQLATVSAEACADWECAECGDSLRYHQQNVDEGVCEVPTPTNQYDPEMYTDGDVRYSLEAVPMFETVPGTEQDA